MPRGVYKRKPRPPRFSLGQRIGKLVLEEYIGRQIVGKRNEADYWDHVFKARCDCGNYRLTSQRYLSNKKHARTCEECSKKLQDEGRAKSTRNQNKGITEVDKEILSVHSMRW